jgi:hypothetical protein
MYTFLISAMCARFPTHLVLLDLFTLINLVNHTSYEAPHYAASHHFLPLRSKYSPEHPVLKHRQSVFHTHTKQCIKYVFVYFNL